MQIQAVEELDLSNGHSDHEGATERFEASYRKKNIPLVLRRAASEWPAIATWNLDYVAERCGSSSGRAMVYGGARPTNLRLPVRDVVARIQSGEKIYLSEAIISSEHPRMDPEIPALMTDLEVPAVVAEKRDRVLAAFFGVDTYASMHFHPDAESLKIQVVGRKRALLIPPDADLPSFPFLSMNFSRISFLDWDRHPERLLERHPELRSLTAYECTLDPGDMLFIPNYWWHSFFGAGLSMSVTYFWNDTQPEYATLPLNYVKTERMKRFTRPMRWITNVPRRIKRALAGS